MNPKKMVRVVGGKRYRTEGAKLLARGQNTFLFMTPKGAYFAQYQSQDEDKLIPLIPAEAAGLYDALPVHEVPFEEAFPHLEVEDA